MYKWFFTIISICIASSYLPAQEEKCNCLDNLNKLVEKTEENYAGFPLKVEQQNKADYIGMLSSLRKKSVTKNHPKECFYLLKEYIRYFRDKHFILNYSNEMDYDNEMISLEEENFKSYLTSGPILPIEGIWINADSTLKLGIKKFNEHSVKAVVLSSKEPNIQPGLVYIEFTSSQGGYMAKEFDFFITTDIPVRQRGNLLQVWNRKMFGKVFPNPVSERERKELDTWKNNNSGLSFEQLSPKTCQLKVPTFLNNDEKIQQLVQNNDSIIRSCDNLIVDLRGNGGGNTGWISFLPYFMTQPIIQYNSYVRVSKENVEAKLKDLEPFAVHPIPDEYQKYFPEAVVRAYQKTYHELPSTKETFYPIPGVTFPLDTLLAKPRKIALLVDDLCGSSTEYFFFLSKQSKKTTTYGINTIGMMDYEGMSTPTPLPYHRYILTIPIARSSWTATSPIDQVGFQPEIHLQHVDPQNWVEFVRMELERH